MKKEVIVFTCDNKCGKSGAVADEDFFEAKPLPKGWSRLVATWNGGTVFNLELCDSCMTAVGNALESRRQE